MRYLAVALGLAGCATGEMALPDGHRPDAHPAGDARPASDGPVAIDAPVAPGVSLLLSEVALAPTGGELIELVNPTAQAVDLSHYYLSDNGSYFKLPAGPVPVTTGDFIVRFPSGASIAPGAVVTVALGTAAAFNTTYGTMPTYSIADGTITTIAVNGTPSLTDTGELVVLFAWNGTASVVKDVDMVIAGVPTSGNGLTPTKSNYAQGTGSYAADANTLPAQATAPAAGTSTKRIAKETGHETQGGNGNGIDGDDETSEITTATWDTTYTAPTPGQVPTVLLQ